MALSGYDIIGDIHGHADELQQLLCELGYKETNGVFSHASRKIIFVGDFIDRGPQIRQVLQMVRGMIDSDSALAVMGNHEFNAIGYHTPCPRRAGEFTRPHSAKNVKQHEQTIKQVPADELADYIDWFRRLPMWLEIDGLRIVHATWDAAQIGVLNSALQQFGGMTAEFMSEGNELGTPLFKAIDDVLKGKEWPLADGLSFADKDGHLRTKMRIKWYEQPGDHTYAEYALSAESGFPHDPIPEELSRSIEPYPATDPPVFFGHYWLRADRPKRLAKNVACVDYSVAKGGALCAYRWDGEQELDDGKFVTVASKS